MTNLQGVYAATVTPFTPGGREVDAGWIPKHLRYLEARGASGVVALGTTGEGPSLTMGERREVIDVVLESRGRLGVICGTGTASLPDTIAVTRYALERGADAVLIVPPFYFKDVTTEGLVAYYATIFESVPVERKILLYNIPSHSSIEISDDLLEALLHRFPDQLLGLKDSSGRLGRLRGYLQRFPQLAVWTGSDTLVTQAQEAGAVGSITAVANVFPDLLVAARAAGEKKTEASYWQSRIDLVRALLGKANLPAGVKHLLHTIAGLPPTHVRPPLTDLTPQQGEEMTAGVRKAGLA